MTTFLKLMRSAWRLIIVIAREIMFAFGELLRARHTAARDHLRFAILAFHDDLAALAGQLKSNATLPSEDAVDRILLIKLDRVGDMVNTTPVFDFLLKRYPHAKLDIVGHAAVLTLLEDDPRISNRFAYHSALYHPGSLAPPGFLQLQLIGKLLRTRYPLVVYLRGSIPFLTLALRAKFVATKFVEGEPVIQRYMKPLGVHFQPNEQLPVPSLHISSISRKNVLAKYPDIEHSPYIVIHAVAAGEGRQWPLERFAHVADEIHYKSGAKLLFLATPAESSKLNQIQALCKFPHHFETDLRLPEAVAAIALAYVFIGNDSGLAHIAAAVGTREIVIWGGANLNMARPISVPGHCSVLFEDVPCRSGCPEIRCNAREHLKCLRSISEASVVSQALAYLKDTQEGRARA